MADERQQERLWGKYRGKVLDNVDPMMLGRIMPEVHSLPDMVLNWAMPCVPFAGDQVGFYAIPPIGANVWIEFEGGDPAYPIWVGGFWSEGEMPDRQQPVEPSVAWIRTQDTGLVLSDLPGVGGVELSADGPAVDVPQRLSMSSQGLRLDCPESSLALTPGAITASCAPADFIMSAERAGMSIGETRIELTEASGTFTIMESRFEGNLSVAGQAEIEGTVTAADFEKT